MNPPRVVPLDPGVADIVRALGCGAPAGHTGHGPAGTLPPDLALALGPCLTLDDMWREIRRIADALRVPERGVQLVTRVQARLRAVAARAAALGAPPRVAFLERADTPVASGGWIPELVAHAGGHDLFGAPGRPARALTWDELGAADPDAVWIAPRDGDLPEARAAAEGLSARAEGGRLGAVRARRVFAGDGVALFHRAGPRVTDALESLAEAIHPVAFRFGHEGKGWSRLGDGPMPEPRGMA